METTTYPTINPSLKTSLRIASAGLLVYMLYGMVSDIPAVRTVILSSVLVRDVLDAVRNALLLLSMALACLALFAHRNRMPVSDKWLRILVYVAAVAALVFFGRGIVAGIVALTISPYACKCLFPCEVVMIMACPYLYMAAWKHYILLGLAIGILWKLSSVEYVESPQPRSFSAALFVSGILPCVVLFLMLVSAIHVLFTGHVIGFGTFLYVLWLRGLVPVVLFLWYAVLIRRSTCQ